MVHFFFSFSLVVMLLSLMYIYNLASSSSLRSRRRLVLCVIIQALNFQIGTSRRRPSSSPSLWKTNPRVIACFGSCPPPRFDSFSEKLVGKWDSTGYLGTSDMIDGFSLSSLTAAPTAVTASVEEVMRSCGGAVQGIRECFPPTIMELSDKQMTETPEGLYLNRANDGFVFQDNGQYSLGPVDWTTTNEQLCATNLMVGKKSRLVIRSDITRDNNKELICDTLPSISYIVKAPLLGSNKNEEDDDNDDSNVAKPTVQFEKDPYSLSLKIHRRVRCCMPSPTQPWMLQRVKWEKEEDPERVETSGIHAEELPGPFNCWKFIPQAIKEYKDWCGYEDPMLLEDNSTVLSMGAICLSTGKVQATARHYNPSHRLTSVLFLEGNFLS